MTDKDAADDKLKRRIKLIVDRTLLLIALTAPALLIAYNVTEELVESGLTAGVNHVSEIMFSGTEWYGDIVLTGAEASTAMMIAGTEASTAMMIAGTEASTSMMIAGTEASTSMMIAGTEIYVSWLFTLIDFATNGMALELLVLGLAFFTAALIGLFVTDHSWAPPMVMVSLLHIWKEAKNRQV